MKKILFLLAFVISGTISAQKVKWMTFDEALAAQQEKAKPILVDAYTNWCGPCKLLDKNTFGNQQVADFINEYYYPVKFNAEGKEEVNYLDNLYTNPRYDPAKAKKRNSQHEFARAMKLRGYPSIVFFDEKGNYIQPVVGYKTPKQLEIYLKMIANGDYKDLTTAEKWQAYQDNFKYEFSGK